MPGHLRDRNAASKALRCTSSLAASFSAGSVTSTSTRWMNVRRTSITSGGRFFARREVRHPFSPSVPLSPRVRRWELNYKTILDLDRQHRAPRGPALVLAGAALGGLVVLLLVSFGFLAGDKQTSAILLGGLPFLFLMFFAMCLL